MEREFRESSDMRPSIAGLAIVLGVAAVLRFWAIGSGIPYAVGVDEPHIMNRVVGMMRTGDFNPHFFDWPSLYIYVQLAVACVHFVLGASRGAWSLVTDISAGDLYLWGRVVTATLGVATVYLVYLIGTRWGARHALLAAGLMAVLPNHVRESHYVLTDVPMTFLVALSFLLTLRALERETFASFAWAGAAAGLAGATKYYGAIILVAPVVAVFFVSQSTTTRLRMALVAIGAAVGCFLLAAPYTVLDLPGFLNGFGKLSGPMSARGPNAPDGWLTYLKHLQIGLAAGSQGWVRATGYGGMLLLAWGFIHGVVRAITGPGKARFTALVVFPVAFLVMITDRTQLFARYLLPILPFVVLLIAIAVVSGVTLSRRFSVPRPARTSAIAVLTVIAILPPAISSIGFDLALGRTSTYKQAYAWIQGNIPPRTGVVVETGGFWLPQPYRCQTVMHLTERSYDAYVADGVSYAVLSGDASGVVFDAPQSEPGKTAAYRELLNRMSLVKAFKRSQGELAPDLRIYKLMDDRPAQTPAVVQTGRPGR